MESAPPLAPLCCPLPSRLWGYENGQGCVFRDPRGYPIFYSDLQVRAGRELRDLALTLTAN